MNGRAGKFLDEERPLKDYPLPGPIGFLEVSTHNASLFPGPIGFLEVSTHNASLLSVFLWEGHHSTLWPFNREMPQFEDWESLSNGGVIKVRFKLLVY